MVGRGRDSSGRGRSKTARVRARGPCREIETDGQRQGLPEMETEKQSRKRQSGKDSLPEIETQKNGAEIKI